MSAVLWLLRGLDIALEVLQWIIFLWVVVSWILLLAHTTSFGWRHRAFVFRVQALYGWLSAVINPFVRPIRRVLARYPSRISGMAQMDWSPLLLILIIVVIRRLLIYAYGSILMR